MNWLPMLQVFLFAVQPSLQSCPCLITLHYTFSFLPISNFLTLLTNLLRLRYIDISENLEILVFVLDQIAWTNYCIIPSTGLLVPEVFDFHDSLRMLISPGKLIVDADRNCGLWQIPVSCSLKIQHLFVWQIFTRIWIRSNLKPLPESYSALGPYCV